jgi:hypothetical protein
MCGRASVKLLHAREIVVGDAILLPQLGGMHAV